MAKVKRKRPAKSASWHAEALDYLQAYQAKHVGALSSLPDLYGFVVVKYDVSIGQFHDGIRELVTGGQIRLHPFSGPRSALEREEYALVMSKEIMYYAECII